MGSIIGRPNRFRRVPVCRLISPGKLDSTVAPGLQEQTLFERRLAVIDAEYAPCNSTGFQNWLVWRIWTRSRDELPASLADRLVTQYSSALAADTKSDGNDLIRGALRLVEVRPPPDEQLAYASVLRDAAREAFNPQPYLILIERLRADGFDREAERVAIRLEVNSRRYAGRHPWDRVVSHLSGAMLKHGYGKGRLLSIVLAWILASSLVFDWGYNRHLITASQGNGPKSASTRPARERRYPAESRRATSGSILSRSRSTASYPSSTSVSGPIGSS